MTNLRHLRAVEALEAEATAVVLGALGSVLDAVAGRFGTIVAAAGDSATGAVGAGEAAASLDDLTRIQPEWSVKVDGAIVPYYDRVFEAGAEGVVEQIGDMRGVAVDLVTQGDPLVLNQRKTQHLAAARERFTRLGDEAWAAARSELLEGFASGEGVEPLKDRITGVVDVTRAQAESLARTEVIAASNAGATANVDAMGDDAPPFKQWVATNDKRTRATHRAADGQVVPKGEPFRVGDASLAYPADYSGPAGEVINCRCSVMFTDTEDPFELPPDLLTEIQAEMASAVVTAAAVLGPQQYNADGTLHTGAMLALVPDTESAERMVVDGGEPVENLHMTLAYLGDADQIPPEVALALREQAELAADGMAPLDGEAFGVAFWNPAGPEPSFNYSIGGPGLVELRDTFLAPIQDMAGWGLPEQHQPWVAHMCAAYGGDPEAVIPQLEARLGTVRFDRVRLALGGTEVYDIPLGEPAAAPEQEGPEMTDIPTDLAGLDFLPGEHLRARMHTQGSSTGQRTFLNLSWRTPPFAYHWQRASSAHGGQPETLMVGQVARVVANPSNPDELYGFVRLDMGSDTGREYGRRVAEGFETGVSVGLDETPFKRTIEWPEDVDPTDPMALMEAVPDQVIIDGGRIGELSGVSVPAQADATLEPSPELLALFGKDQAPEVPAELVASAGPPRVLVPSATAMADQLQALTAAAFRIEVREQPPQAWYQKPNDVDIASALTITDKGRIYGAVAPLGTNHRAFVNSGRRQEVPIGNVDYSRFMGGWGLSDGGLVPAGPLTMDTGHAPMSRMNHEVGRAHYDNTGAVIGAICVGEDRERGLVWMAGALVPGVGIDKVARALACRCSGDWQRHPEKAGWMELVACLLVPSPGFAMAHKGASTTWDQDGALVASSVPVRGPALPSVRTVGPYAEAANAIAESIGVGRRQRQAEYLAMVQEDSL
jgi:hypothetical protein